MSTGYIRAWPRYAQSDPDVDRIYPRLAPLRAIEIGCRSDVDRMHPRVAPLRTIDFGSSPDASRHPVTRNRNQIDAAPYAAIGSSISSAGGFTATLGLNQNRNITKITADPVAGINQIDLQSCVITPFAPTV